MFVDTSPAAVYRADPATGAIAVLSGGGQCLGNVFGCAIPPLGGRGVGARLYGDDGAIESEQSLAHTAPRDETRVHQTPPLSQTQ